MNRELDETPFMESRSALIRIRKHIDESGKRELETELIHTLRNLSRSHRRFSEEQKVRVNGQSGLSPRFRD